MEIESTEDLITLAEAAKAAGVNPATIRGWVKRGHLVPRGMDLSRRVLYKLSEVMTVERETRHRVLGTSRRLPKEL